MFNGPLGEVALIRKNKPVWQAGKLNGIGGKIEGDEAPIAAMIREFNEEGGMVTFDSDWKHYCVMSGVNDDGAAFEVYFFAAIGPVHLLVSTTDEKIEIVNTDEVDPLRHDMIENLCWLVAAAVDHLVDGRPAIDNSAVSLDDTLLIWQASTWCFWSET